MSLLETFNEMKKEAQAEAQETEAHAGTQEEMEILNKYAEWAVDVLNEEKGEGNYTEAEVEKLAEAKLEEDAEELMRREKVAELYEAGQIMYQGFKEAAQADTEN